MLIFHKLLWQKQQWKETVKSIEKNVIPRQSGFHCRRRDNWTTRAPKHVKFSCHLSKDFLTFLKCNGNRTPGGRGPRPTLLTQACTTLHMLSLSPSIRVPMHLYKHKPTHPWVLHILSHYFCFICVCLFTRVWRESKPPSIFLHADVLYVRVGESAVVAVVCVRVHVCVRVYLHSDIRT